MPIKKEILERAAQILGEDLWCDLPNFTIFDTGEFFPCCPDYINKYSFGNIYTDSIDELLNGEKAKRFKDSILNKTFEFCNLDMCVNYSSLKVAEHYHNRKIHEKENSPFKIRRLCMNLDSTCNVRCVTCRDKILKETEEDFEKKKEIFDKKIVPIFETNPIERVFLNGCGEVFVSNISLYVIEQIIKKFPNVKFDIITNGILFNKYLYEKYHLKNKIGLMQISIHAITKETYDKIVREGNFAAVKRNIEYAVELKNNNEIQEIILNFVVSSLNYREMIAFQEYANKLNVNTHFSEYRKWNNNEMDRNYSKYTVFKKDHPEYAEFKKIVDNDIFKSPKININLKLTN
jgi:molybdenum cofactor biosynthesis enzyme MoaA